MIDARDPNGLRCNAATHSPEWGVGAREVVDVGQIARAF
jgi:hypothetical protein